MKKLLKEDSYDFKRLKVQYPYSSKFYSYYDDGDYYNTSKTYYYDENEKQVEIKDHKCYG